MRPWIIEYKLGDTWVTLGRVRYYRAHLAQTVARAFYSLLQMRIRNTLTNEVRDV